MNFTKKNIKKQKNISETIKVKEQQDMLENPAKDPKVIEVY